jgi:5'(3')-deoxyribonucleotidase
MSKLKIIWDLDCILSDMIPCVCDRILSDFGVNITPAEITQWDLRKVTGIPNVGSIFDKRMMLGQPPMADALRYFPTLWDKTDSIIATQCVNDTYREKAEWLRKHYPFVDTDNRVAFIKMKERLSGDALVDDNGETCVKWLTEHPCGIAIMLSYPYNLNIETGPPEVNARLFRVRDWRDIDWMVNWLIQYRSEYVE